MRPKPCWQRQVHIWKNGELQTPVAIDCCQEVREDRFIPCLGGALILRRMKKLLALLSLIFLAACTSDVVESNYATLAEARADQLFGRGWLPDVLPASAFNIRTSNNLDLNQSEGEFSFRPDDSGDLFQKCTEVLPAQCRTLSTRLTSRRKHVLATRFGPCRWSKKRGCSSVVHRRGAASTPCGLTSKRLTIRGTGGRFTQEINLTPLPGIGWHSLDPSITPRPYLERTPHSRAAP